MTPFTWDGATWTWGGATWTWGGLAITVSGVPIKFGALTAGDRLDERAILTATLLGPAPVKGSPVAVIHDGTEVFAGFVEQSQEVAQGSTLLSQIQAVDLDQLADRRVVARGWAGVTVRSIAQDLVDDYLAAEGVVLASGPDGPLVAEAAANYVPVSNVLNALTERAGWWWSIRNVAGQRTLHVLPRIEQTAPWTVGVTSPIRDLTVEHRGPEYRNRQWIKGGKAKTDIQTERFRGDGDQTSFTVGFPIAELPTITLDGAPQDVGVRGIDDGIGKHWLFSFNSGTFTRGADFDAPADGLIVEVTYRGFFSLVAVQGDTDAITQRQAAEGSGSGLVEAVSQDPDATDRTSAFEKAATKLAKYATVGRKVSFQTFKPGLRAGQMLTVTRPEHGLSGVEVLIVSVSTTITSRPLYDVEAIEGPIEGSWLEFFRRLAQQPRVLEFRENLSEDETVVRLFEFAKVWAEPPADLPNIFDVWLADGTVLPSDGRLPGFDPPTRITHVEAEDGVGATLVRRPLTTATGMETDEIVTQTILQPLDAAGETVAEVVWYGGWASDHTEGSGVEIAREPLDEVKTAAEEFLLSRTDSKGVW